MDGRAAEVDRRVLDSAVRLFAELGYDATDLQLIAASAGVAPAESALLGRGKPEIYRAALEQIHMLEIAYFDAAAKDSPDDIQGVHLLVDAAFDFALEHPESGAIWAHRGLHDAQDLTFPEGFAPHLETVLTSRSWHGIRSDVDLHFLAWTIIWMVMGFAQTGLPDERTRRHGPTDESASRRFRAELHELIDARLRPRPELPGGASVLHGSTGTRRGDHDGPR